MFQCYIKRLLFTKNFTMSIPLFLLYMTGKKDRVVWLDMGF